MIHLLVRVDRAEEVEGVEDVEDVEVEVAGAVGVVREVAAAVAAVREGRVVEGEEEEEAEGEAEIKVREDIRMPRGQGGMIRRCREWALSSYTIGISEIIPSSIPSQHHSHAHCPLK